MSRKILSLIRNQARLHTLGELGKAEAAGIDWANTALQLVEVYGELI
jgi:hypothetical protein